MNQEQNKNQELIEDLKFILNQCDEIIELFKKNEWNLSKTRVEIAVNNELQIKAMYQEYLDEVLAGK